MRDLLINEDHLNRIFIEQAPTAIAMFDKEMRYLAVSKQWVIDYQLEGVKLIGRSHYEVFPEIGEDWKKIHRDCLNGEVNTCEESLFTRSNGLHQWISWEVRPWYIKTGKIGGLLMYTEEITRRKEEKEKLRLSEEWFRGAFEYSAVGLAIVAINGDWIKVNMRFCRIIGYTLEELKSITFKDITHPDDLAHNLSLMQELLDSKRESYKLEKRYIHKNGHSVWVFLIVSMVKDRNGAPLHLVALVNDITSKKNAEDKLEKYARTLELKNKELQQFTYIASHDLREPLNTIISLLDIIKEDNYDELGDELRQLVDYIGSSTMRMNNLIKGLLEYSRMDEKVTMSEVNLNNTVEQVISDLKSSIQGADCEIKAHQLPTVRGNDIQLRILYQNLISNCLKFKKSDEVLRVEIGIKHTDDKCLLYVSDNGIGIEPKHHERIFQIFQRLNSKEAYDGTGLGLATCAKLVAFHDGEIWVESSPGKGSIFYFTLG